jgi:soluble lytic murein transglycosylase-like protein
MGKMQRAACVIASLAVLGAQACTPDVMQSKDSAPPGDFQAFAQPVTTPPPTPAQLLPSTASSQNPGGPPLDLMVIKSMLYAAAVKHGVNPYLVMGVAWWESGWNESAVSSAGAVGVMQIMPATGEADGPVLLGRKVDLTDIADNIDLGAAILRNNLNGYHGDLVKVLVAYYAGPSAIRDWNHLDPGAQRYVWGIYHLAVAFQNGVGPV